MSIKSDYLVCVNSEKYSEVALRFACKIAKGNNASVIILHVIEPSNYNSFGAIADKMLVESHQNANILLKSLSKIAHQEYNITSQLAVKEGLIEEQIIDFLENHDTVKMLLIGSSSNDGPIKSKVLPSLVEQTGKKLKVPINIVPGNLEI